MKNKKFVTNQGITLVALVITIIVLLILAGVAINLAMDSNGLFAKANDAVTKWNASVAEEDRTIEKLLNKMNEINGETVEQGSISLNKSTLALEIVDGVNANETLVATKKHIEGTITWTSSEPTVATVDSNGKVTTMGEGETTITASCGGYTATCAVTVTAKTTPKVTLGTSNGEVSSTLEVEVESTLELTATLNVTATQNIVWTSSDESIATVVGSGTNNTTGTITGVKNGTVTITATYGDKTTTCSVTVKEKPTLIVFTIDGETYYAEKGMKWWEWSANSTYNTRGIPVAPENGGFVYTGEEDYRIALDGRSVLYKEEIVENATYNVITAGVNSGGAN